MTDQRRRGARGVAMGVGGLAAFIMLVAACGIQPTTVVDAGAPPSGFTSVDPPDPVNNEPGQVYFVRAGKLAVAERPGLRNRALAQYDDSDKTDPSTQNLYEVLVTVSLVALLVGPSADEVASGIRSVLPHSPQKVQKTLQVTSPDPTSVQLFLPAVADELSPLAAFQITCTVLVATDAAGHPPNVVFRRFDDGRVKRLPDCPLGLG